MKIVYYKPLRTTIDVAGLAKRIIDVKISHDSFLNLFVHDRDSLFMSKFWFSPCNFFGIK